MDHNEEIDVLPYFPIIVQLTFQKNADTMRGRLHGTTNGKDIHSFNKDSPPPTPNYCKVNYNIGS